VEDARPLAASPEEVEPPVRGGKRSGATMVVVALDGDNGAALASPLHDQRGEAIDEVALGSPVDAAVAVDHVAVQDHQFGVIDHLGQRAQPARVVGRAHGPAEVYVGEQDRASNTLGKVHCPADSTPATVCETGWGGPSDTGDRQTAASSRGQAAAAVSTGATEGTWVPLVPSGTDSPGGTPVGPLASVPYSAGGPRFPDAAGLNLMGGTDTLPTWQAIREYVPLTTRGGACEGFAKGIASAA